MSSPKLRLIFRPKSEIQTFLSPQNQVVSKKKKVFTKIETDFSAEIGNSNVFFRPKSGGLQKKKKKKVLSQNWDWFFRPDSLRLGRWGVMHPEMEPELFKIRADFSANIVTFRLVGGDASPPLNPPLIGR